MTLVQAISSTSALTADQIAACQSLLVACNAFERIDLPFFLESEALDSSSATSFLAFDGPRLLGFGHLPDDPVPEACLMVDPGHRRPGIGAALLESMRSKLGSRGLQECLVVADQASESGKAFLGAAKLPYQSSEFRLELDRPSIDRSRPPISRLSMRPATHADAAALTAIRASALGDVASEVRDHIDRGLNEKNRRFCLAYFDDQPVGMLRAGEFAGIGDVTAFGVLPEHQGRGFGRQMLLAAVDLLTGAGFDRIAIEVATENANALGLYKSCGFRVVSEYGYYRLAVK